MKFDIDKFLADKKMFRLCPEWASSGVWVPGGMVHEDDLGISDELKRRLIDWQALWDAQPNTERMFEDGSEPTFVAEGLEVARLLSKELGSGTAIEYALVFIHEFQKSGKMVDVYALFHEGRCVAIYPERGPKP